ncbi:MAG TPA: MBL fold metallo-hydrolase [Spirochaetia bacterium]|nr:MBL fold metallo-hydrolase [Spirochaetia bacterium]
MSDKNDHGITFLGTAAAQGVPPVYASDLERGPAAHGKDLRTRSAIRIGQEHQIDAGPDTHWQLAREGMSWFDLEHLIITHTHSDHFYFDGILQKSNARENNGRPLNVYMSEKALDWFMRSWCFLGTLRAPTDDDIAVMTETLSDWYRFHTLRFFEFTTIGDLSFCPIPGAHHGRLAEEQAMNYIVEFGNGRRLLYGLDTGYYDDTVFEFLSSMQLDTVVLDCTFGGRTDRPEQPYGHLDCRSLIKVLERMSSGGTIRASTPIYATHINPDQGLNHEQLNAWFMDQPFAVQVAWDGMKITLGQ